MAVDLANLSSNWKVLQKTLQKEKKPATATATHGTAQKRKYTNGEDTVIKKRKFDLAKKTKMGASVSKEHVPAATTAKVTPSSAFNDADENQIDVLRLNEPFTPNLGHYPPAVVSKHKYIAIDCEMVGIGPPPHEDSQLARVSITNYHGELLYDSYVQPIVPVTDYRTFVSGITEELLRPDVARPFKTVQSDVAELFKGRILVGHAIQNDLSALILQHPRRDIRDTSRHPTYRAISAGRTPALKKLAKEFLGLEIQSGEHSSVDDARATMALFIREKEGFEREGLKRFGPARVEKEPEIDEEAEEARKEKQRMKNRKKNKKKKRK